VVRVPDSGHLLAQKFCDEGWLSQPGWPLSALWLHDTRRFKLWPVAFEKLFLFQRINTIPKRPVDWENFVTTPLPLAARQYAQALRYGIFKQRRIFLAKLRM
jgi:hypothetical protein